jgi:hypothetical protein
MLSEAGQATIGEPADRRRRAVERPMTFDLLLAGSV